MSDATALLLRWNSGDESAREALLNEVYDELTAIASRHVARESHTHEWQPAALVNEAYLRLIDMNRIEWKNRAHFLALAATVMRRVLIDQARRQNAAKRDGGQRVTISNVSDSKEPATDLLMLHAALGKLQALDPERAKVVELRFFSGMTFEEAAIELGKSSRTVKRQWEVARGWLFREMNATLPPEM